MSSDSEVKRVALRADQLQAMRAFRDQRDKEALRVGIAKLEYEQYVASAKQMIASINGDENKLVMVIAAQHDLKVDSGRIEFDYERGELVWRSYHKASV